MSIATALEAYRNRIETAYTELGNRNIDLGTSATKNMANLISIIKHIRNVYEGADGKLYREYDRIYTNANCNFYIDYTMNIESVLKATVQCVDPGRLQTVWTSNNNLSFYFYSSAANNRFGNNATLNISNNNNHKLNIKQSKIGIGQVDYPGWSDNNRGNYNQEVMIFDGNPTINLFGDGNRRFKGNFWNATISENEEVLVDLRPVLRLEDNKTGLYDVVNRKFYEPVGTAPSLQYDN